MKNVITVVILVSTLAVGCSQPESVSQNSSPATSPESKVIADTTKVDIFEAVLRHHFEITEAKAPVFFIGIANADPSPELMSRFTSHKTPVKGISAFNKDAGVRFSISEIKMQSTTIAEVHASHWLGNMGRGIYKHTVEKKDGKWIVTKDEILGQS